MVGDCLGLGDHEMVEFRTFAVMRKKRNLGNQNRIDSRNFKKANFRLFREVLSRIPQESAFEGLGVHECCSVFKNHL